MPRFTRNRVIALVLTAAAVIAAAFAAAPRRVVRRAPYTVSVESANAIQDAAGIVCLDRSGAERIGRRRNLEDCDNPAVPSDPPGRWQLQVSAICTREWSWFGRNASYTQEQYLVVVAVLADGRHVGKVVELPDARESQEVTVRLD